MMKDRSTKMQTAGSTQEAIAESIAGANTFSDRKNEASKCCDISFDLLMVKTKSEKQAERRYHLRTLLR